MAQTILILNGPNLNLLGEREPEVYGPDGLSAIADRVRAALPEGWALDARQSNHEGVLIDWIHEARGTAAGIVINPGAYTHTSIAILDALKTYGGPVLEVHLSNIHRREPFRHRSYVSARADGVIAGLGPAGYVAAALRVVEMVPG